MSTFDPTGAVFTCPGTDYTVLGGVVRSVLHDSFAANGSEHVTGTTTPIGVTLTDGTAVYRLSGATWFGGNFSEVNGKYEFTDTEFFNIIAPGEGVGHQAGDGPAPLGHAVARLAVEADGGAGLHRLGGRQLRLLEHRFGGEAVGGGQGHAHRAGARRRRHSRDLADAVRDRALPGDRGARERRAGVGGVVGGRAHRRETREFLDGQTERRKDGQSPAPPLSVFSSFRLNSTDRQGHRTGGIAGAARRLPFG